MAFEQYPADLPQSPLVSGYKDVMVDNIRVSPMDSGAKKRRKRYTKALPVPMPCPMPRFTTAQKESFKNWFETSLQDGVRPFEWYRPDLDKTIVCWFKDGKPPEFIAVAGGEKWKVTFFLEVEDK